MTRMRGCGGGGRLTGPPCQMGRSRLVLLHMVDVSRTGAGRRGVGSTGASRPDTALTPGLRRPTRPAIVGHARGCPPTGVLPDESRNRRAERNNTEGIVLLEQEPTSVAACRYSRYATGGIGFDVL